ncbi:hypothetical protein D4716_22020 [Shigella boydii]|nr:hypothetical protein [Shigella boydii]EGD4893910.1 hypothetical protein [Shigella boydii]EGE0881663.1 hypothetical protein [Shigella boydii]EGE1642976.1 hypothetical protein [Shigella boydii]
MQCPENDPDAFFRFSLGKTSLFGVSASESRSARFNGAYNTAVMLNILDDSSIFHIWLWRLRNAQKNYLGEE